MPRTVPLAIFSVSRLIGTENFIISQAFSLEKYQSYLKKRVPEIVEIFIIVIITQNKERQRVSYRNEHKTTEYLRISFVTNPNIPI